MNHSILMRSEISSVKLLLNKASLLDSEGYMQTNWKYFLKKFGSLEYNIYLCTRNQEMIATISRSGAVVARWAHNPKVVSSSLASATKESPLVIDLGLFLYSIK